MDSEKYIVISFYKYVTIDNLDVFRKVHLKKCNEIGLRGRILVADEGINGNISGTREQCEKFIKYIQSDKRFSDMLFKQQSCIEVPFDKMTIKIKKQILPFEKEVDLALTGDYLSVSEFLEIYDSKGNLKENVVLIDNRNYYEWEVGRFKGALKPSVEIFRDFPKIVDELKGKEGKKIVMYCTGGIRCEKASAYMRAQGFKDVSQLQGGVLAFGNKDYEKVWEGKCFVFDKRILSAVNKTDKAIVGCGLCGKNCDHYHNCSFPDCNKFIALCRDCNKENRGCCSSECLRGLENFFKRKMEKNRFRNQCVHLGD